MRWTWTVVLALAAGCAGIELEQLVPQHDPLSRVAAEPAGVHCEHGGSVVLTGLDLDDDGVLSDGEVRDTGYFCDDPAPVALTRTREEPAGTHCVHGGQAVETGVDADGSGVLEDAEVTATEYLCATAIPRVLMRAQVMPPGEQCPHGGQVSRAGYDANDNGELEDAEVTREVYGCTEPGTIVTRVAPARVSPCINEGTQVEAGVDLDGDGVLDDEERRASVSACMEPARAFVRQRPEPAGAACAAGGTRVEVGLDVDQDGELDDEEASASAFVCHPSRTFDGNYEVKSAADVAALQGIGRVRGSVSVFVTSLTELVLPGLQSVEGQLSLHGNGTLTRVELTGLRFVGQDMRVIGNLQLETLILGNMTGSGSPLWVQGNLLVETNPRLPTLLGLRSVVPHGDITLSDNDAMGTPGTFDYIRELPGSIIVSDNDVLRQLPFTHLQRLGGSFTLTANKVLPALTCPNLASIAGSLEVSRNAALTDLSGMPLLESITGGLAVMENDGLRTTAGMDSLYRVGALHLAGNPLLETAAAFPALRVANSLSITENALLASPGTFLLRSLDRLTITHNPLLTDLKGFEKLESVRALTIEFNNGLTRLADLGHLRSLEELSVVDNPQLTRLDLNAMQRVEQLLVISANPKLPTCLATSFATRVFLGLGGPARISGNDSTATCN